MASHFSLWLFEGKRANSNRYPTHLSCFCAVACIDKSSHLYLHPSQPRLYSPLALCPACPAFPAFRCSSRGVSIAAQERQQPCRCCMFHSFSLLTNTLVGLVHPLADPCHPVQIRPKNTSHIRRLTSLTAHGLQRSQNRRPSGSLQISVMATRRWQIPCLSTRKLGSFDKS